MTRKTITRQEAFALISGERAYQDKRWNELTTTSEGNHSPQEWLTYIDHYVKQALHVGCTKPDQEAKTLQMDIIRKIGALAVAAMENNGAPPRVTT